VVATGRRGDVARQTADAILSYVRDAGLGSGARIPTERTLGEDLGLSRHSLRKALHLLETDGWISREVGRGTFLRPSAVNTPRASADLDRRASRPAVPRRDLVPRLTPGSSDADTVSSPGAARSRSTNMSDVGPADVMAVRHVLEPNSMPLVVARATARDFEQMANCLQGGDKASTHEEFEFWDLALHRAILASTRNSLLMRLYDCVEDARHGPIWGDLKRRNSSDERRDEYRRDHHAIVAALSARDSARAMYAMQAHLSRIDGHLFGNLGESRDGRFPMPVDADV
jgi:GntR family transcriptional regulator, uxu operon transcriptional repressor